MKYRYKIGELIFEWKSDIFEPVADSDIGLFNVFDENSDTISEPKSLTADQKKVIIYGKSDDLSFFKDKKYCYKDGTLERYIIGDDEYLVFHWGTCRYAYAYKAIRMDQFSGSNNIELNCYINPKINNEVDLSVARLFSTLSLHSVFLQQGFTVLHASYISWHGKAILFTAPSGTGKSTQASLWNQYQNAEIINGDRVLIGRNPVSGKWTAYGYPCCGSSNICKNVTLEIGMIVVLEQAPENLITDMRAGQKGRALFSAEEVFTWSMSEIDQALKIAGEIVGDVPILKLKCRPDEEAVNVLKRRLLGLDSFIN